MKAKSLLVGAGVLGAAVSQATILTFDITGIGNHGAMPAAYGDNVTSGTMGNFAYGVGAEGFTPDVTVGYGPGTAAPAWWNTGYGDLTNILFEDNDGQGILEVTFTAAAGFLVNLYSWDMAAFSSAFSSDPTINWVRVTDGTNTLFDSQNQVISESTHTAFDFSATPFTAQTLVLSFNSGNLGGLSDDIAFDNIRFGQQVVPEPATLAAMGLGVAAMALRRRRQK